MRTPSYSPNQPLLTVDDLRQTLRIGRTQVYELIRRGELPTVRVGARIRFRPEDVDAYLERETR
jgi:excisionase family DNA binding protein